MTALSEEYWLDILYHFHLTPAEQDMLTVYQFLDIVEAVKHIRIDAAK